MSQAKLHIIFVGAFPKRPEHTVAGGQIYASQTLIQSPISEYVEWSLIDSTMLAVPPPPVWRRLLSALKRVVQVILLLFSRRLDGLLIFTSSGLSFLEKGLIGLIGFLGHTTVVMCPRDGFMPQNLKQSRFMRWYVPFVLRRCTYVVCQSGYWKTFYQVLTGLPDMALPVLKNWMNITTYCALPLPNDPKTMTVLFMGWLERFKGIYDLLDAVYQQRESLNGTHLVICGNGSELAMVKAYIQKLGLGILCELRGWVQGQEKLRAFSEADVFVLPSYVEGTPNAVLEAMAAGRAVIATRVGGIPDLIEPEKTGILIEAGDIAALGVALVRLRQHPELRQALGEQARQYIHGHHDISNIWPQLLNLFQRKKANRK
jgi:glycosyltransferase involved in cell wall biosynthesis